MKRKVRNIALSVLASIITFCLLILITLGLLNIFGATLEDVLMFGGLIAPTPTPTPTPTPMPDDLVIRAVQTYRLLGYDCTIAETLATYFIAGKDLGEEIRVDGWYVLPQGKDYLVRFCYAFGPEEEERGYCDEWLYDPQREIVSPHAQRTKFLLMNIPKLCIKGTTIEDAISRPTPTPTPILVPLPLAVPIPDNPIVTTVLYYQISDTNCTILDSIYTAMVKGEMSGKPMEPISWSVEPDLFEGQYFVRLHMTLGGQHTYAEWWYGSSAEIVVPLEGVALTLWQEVLFYGCLNYKGN